MVGHHTINRKRNSCSRASIASFRDMDIRHALWQANTDLSQDNSFKMASSTSRGPKNDRLLLVNSPRLPRPPHTLQMHRQPRHLPQPATGVATRKSLTNMG